MAPSSYAPSGTSCSTAFLSTVYRTPIPLPPSISGSYFSAAAYSLEKTARELAGGDLSKEFRLRKHDYLQQLAGSLNEWVVKLRERQAALEEIAAALEKRLASIRASGNIPESDLKELDEALARFRSELTSKPSGPTDPA